MSNSKNVYWGNNNTIGQSSGVNHGVENASQGKQAQKLVSLSHAMFGRTGDTRFLKSTGDAPSGEEAFNTIKNSKKPWGGKKTKSKSKRHKKTKKAYKKKYRKN